MIPLFSAQVCPALIDIEEAAWSSSEWDVYNTSEWTKKVNQRMEKELPGYQWDNMLDCLHTTACTSECFLCLVLRLARLGLGVLDA